MTSVREAMPGGFVKFNGLRRHESDVTGELYFQLRKQGITPAMEVRLPTALKAARYFRVDMAIVKNDELLAVIEIKKRQPPKKIKTMIAAGREWNVKLQQRVYEHFTASTGVPVIWVYGFSGINAAVTQVAEIWNKG